MSGRIFVRVVETRGSAPRDAGASMVVNASDEAGTIGGGVLELEATRIARDMIREGQRAARRSFALGPSLGQCCGGHVTLEFSHQGHDPDFREPPLWVWGAGHVGRAIVSTVAPLSDRKITWIDTAQNRFPDDMPEHVAPLIARDPVRAVTHAPANACHLILTYSHDMDLALCDSLLRHGFGFAGLIGSATKKARFMRRLTDLGHRQTEISRITCPIGDPGLGKHPQAIAIGVAAQIMAIKDGAKPGGDRAR